VRYTALRSFKSVRAAVIKSGRRLSPPLSAILIAGSIVFSIAFGAWIDKRTSLAPLRAKYGASSSNCHSAIRIFAAVPPRGK
jgi:hypothetical protein